MAFHKKSKLLIASLLVIITLTFTTFTITRASSDETKAKETIVDKIVQFLQDKKVKGSEEKLKVIANSVYAESQQYDLDYRLVLAIMKVESNFKHDAISKDGARGLLQIRPILARHVSKNAGIPVKNVKSLHEPEKNIKIGVNHLSWLMEKFEDVDTALHAYNAGHKKAEARVAANKVQSTRFARQVLREYEQIVAVLPEPNEK
jgi:soluble lytic murein transglycosylase